jgi:hypothetical protein
MDAEFVDVVGLSPAREHQLLLGESNGNNTGVLRQTANNVRIENLKVWCIRSSGGAPLLASTPAAYFPDANTPDTVVRNCEFASDDLNAWSMRLQTDYSGTYINCKAGSASFTYDAIANGTFIDCVGKGTSFAAYGTASGTFESCTGGNFSFGYASTASGTFTNCTAGSSSFGAGGDATGGKFYYCRAGDFSFTTTGSPVVLHCIRGNLAYPEPGWRPRPKTNQQL